MRGGFTVVIRAATTDDYRAFAALHGELGVVTPPPTRERFGADLVPHTLIAERDGRIAGYLHVQTLGTIGYVRQIAVAPFARGDGLDRALMIAAARELRAGGVTTWHLDVSPVDRAAIALYESLGLRVEHRSTALRFPWERLLHVPGDAATVLPVAAGEDDDIERALGLLSGQIAMARARRGHVLVQLRDADCAAVGFAAFDPAFPGVRVFRVARPTLAAALLGAIYPHARDRALALVIDDDDATADLLVAHGAEVTLRLLHYTGALPVAA